MAALATHVTVDETRVNVYNVQFGIFKGDVIDHLSCSCFTSGIGGHAGF